ncbi:MAG: GNAT family N-acetyltransferase, partial [Candidatus Thorarchaeota archaeon]|jgi:GNAT superfamily N-acetyltransferase
MKDKIEITLAQPEDAEILTEISKRAFDSDIEVGAPGPGGPPDYDSVDAHRKDTENKRIDYWKFLFNETIVGGTRVYKVSDAHGYMYGVFVDPDYHGKGIGTATFQMMERKYPEVQKWTLDTPEWNPRTKGFYEKIGFVQKGILRWVPTFDLRYFIKVVDDTYEPQYEPIAELQEGMKGVVAKGRIQEISDTRNVTSKEGKPQQVVNAILADETGSVTLVLWNDMIRQVQEGEDVIIENGYVSSFKGNLQLNVARRGQIIITRTS